MSAMTPTTIRIYRSERKVGCNGKVKFRRMAAICNDKPRFSGSRFKFDSEERMIWEPARVKVRANSISKQIS